MLTIGNNACLHLGLHTYSHSCEQIDHTFLDLFRKLNCILITCLSFLHKRLSPSNTTRPHFALIFLLKYVRPCICNLVYVHTLHFQTCMAYVDFYLFEIKQNTLKVLTKLPEYFFTHNMSFNRLMKRFQSVNKTICVLDYL